MITPKSLDDNILYQIGEASRLVHKRVTELFLQREFNVTVEQFGVLVLLWYEEGLNQQIIADRLKRNKASITRIIKNMIKRNLIVKVPDRLDKRNKLIYLTQKGKTLQKEMIESSGLIYQQALGNIEPKEAEDFLITLSKININLK